MNKLSSTIAIFLALTAGSPTLAGCDFTATDKQLHAETGREIFRSAYASAEEAGMNAPLLGSIATVLVASLKEAGDLAGLGTPDGCDLLATIQLGLTVTVALVDHHKDPDVPFDAYEAGMFIEDPREIRDLALRR